MDKPTTAVYLVALPALAAVLRLEQAAAAAARKAQPLVLEAVDNNEHHNQQCCRTVLSTDTQPLARLAVLQQQGAEVLLRSSA